MNKHTTSNKFPPPNFKNENSSSNINNIFYGLYLAQAPLSEEERMATMTQEERDEYRRKIAERLKSDRDLTEARVTTTTTTTTTYLVDRNSGSVEAIPLDSEPIQASGIGSEKDEDKYAVAYGEEKDQERLSAQVRVQLLEQAEDDKRREEEEERNK